MKKENKESVYEKFLTNYNILKELQQIDSKAVLEMRITDNEKKIPKIKLSLVATDPSIQTEINLTNESYIQATIELIMKDFVDYSFVREEIAPEEIINFSGSVETKSSHDKARLVLGVLQEYPTYAKITKKILKEHNENLEIVPNPTNKVYSFDK